MNSQPAPGFSVKPLPVLIRSANAAARVLGIGVDVLKPERVMQDAARKAGLPPDFPGHVHEALDVLYRSLREEAALHGLGIANNQNMLVTGLSQLLLIEKMFADDPSLSKEPLLSPIVVTGLPRSGTTFLHRMLSAAPDAMGVPLHRHVYPVRPQSFDYRTWEVRLLLQPWHAASKVYNLDAIHYVRSDLPDECNFGMRLGGRSMIYWGTNPVHTYLRWLLAQDLRESYQLYRKVLILHQRANPGRRLTLKCPHHLAWLPAFTEALPEATIVQTHRDPVEAVPSECKLILSLHGVSVRELDWKRTVESNQFKVHTYAERSVAFADTEAGRKIMHVDYRRIVRDPVGVAADVHRHAGLPLTDAHKTALAGFASENRQHKHGKNVYKLEDYGLDADRLADDFAAYRERFITPKQDCLTGPIE